MGQPVIAAQVNEALTHRDVHAAVRDSIAVDAMVGFLNLNAGTWLHFSSWDVHQSDIGACSLIDEDNFRGRSKGSFHLADSGMQFIGSRKPKHGLSQLF